MPKNKTILTGTKLLALRPVRDLIRKLHPVLNFISKTDGSDYCFSIVTIGFLSSVPQL